MIARGLLGSRSRGGFAVAVLGLLAFGAGIASSHLGVAPAKSISGTAMPGYHAMADDGGAPPPSVIDAALARAQRPSDRLPDDVSAGVDRESSRRVRSGSAHGSGSDETVRFYVVRPATGSGLCVVGTIANTQLTTACYPPAVLLDSRIGVGIGTPKGSRRVSIDRGDVVLY